MFWNMYPLFVHVVFLSFSCSCCLLPLNISVLRHHFFINLSSKLSSVILHNYKKSYWFYFNYTDVDAELFYEKSVCKIWKTIVPESPFLIKLQAEGTSGTQTKVLFCGFWEILKKTLTLANSSICILPG